MSGIMMKTSISRDNIFNEEIKDILMNGLSDLIKVHAKEIYSKDITIDQIKDGFDYFNQEFCAFKQLIVRYDSKTDIIYGFLFLNHNNEIIIQARSYNSIDSILSVFCLFGNITDKVEIMIKNNNDFIRILLSYNFKIHYKELSTVVLTYN